ncbi:winged helix-turn-helix domain-containing protein [Arachidicoccus terrestris]|uniref:winged helix-turn-helix domain-containing protein n=1 Tax=Arachidicoccus terrestris TaxID=2875539 RepID=UPI001CC6C2D2|nr:winged helix-turn-helix domain-containing protein [Arachidicoccus terrestris]
MDSVETNTITDRLNDRLNVAIKSLIKVINENPGLDTNKISSMVQISIRTTGRYIKQLKDNNIIEFIGSQKTEGYYLTSEAKSFM